MDATSRYDSLILFYAQAYTRDPRQVKRQIRRESNFHPQAESPAGAKGLCQFEPTTWAGEVVRDGETSTLLFDPEAQIRTLCKLMARLERRFQGLDKALAAYNWGEGHLQEVVEQPDWLRFCPRETQDYVHYCMDYLVEKIVGFLPV